MAYEDIYSRYKNLYDAQNNALAQKKNSAIQGYTNQQNDMTNQYADLANQLKTKADSTKAQYSNLYKGLDQQNVQAKDTNYTDRNQVDVGVNQNLNRVQELMAKNGWLGGGENLQAQLNSNSDRMSGFGSADKTMGNTLNTVLNNRNQYQADEQTATNDINNQSISNEREKATKLQAIMDAINSANVNYGADSQALKANLDAQAMGEVYNAEQTAKAQAFQASQNALSRSSSSGGGSSSGASASKADGVNGAWNDYLSFGDDLDAANAYLSDPDIRSQIINSIGAAEYNKLRSDYESRKKAANSKITSYINKTVAPSQNYSIGQTYGGGRSLMS